jgi:hypothetical protein
MWPQAGGLISGVLQKKYGKPWKIAGKVKRQLAIFSFTG